MKSKNKKPVPRDYELKDGERVVKIQNRDMIESTHSTTGKDGVAETHINYRRPPVVKKLKATSRFCPDCMTWFVLNREHKCKGKKK